MASKEGTPLQQDMFSGDWKDNRTRSQRRAEREQSKPQQSSMFALEETYEFGATYRPWLKEVPAGSLQLEREDIRTSEEIERDLIQEANSLTTAMFQENEATTDSISDQEPVCEKTDIHVPIIGYREQARRKLVNLRPYSQR